MYIGKLRLPRQSNDCRKEIQAQLRGEGGTVDPICFEDIRKCYVMSDIPFKEATKDLTKKFMKKTGWDKYYEHATQITSFISQKTAQWANDEEQMELDVIFMEAKIAWENAPPEIKGTRTNFPNYEDFTMVSPTRQTILVHLSWFASIRSLIY
jgi:hypothetical protein